MEPHYINNIMHTVLCCLKYNKERYMTLYQYITGKKRYIHALSRNGKKLKYNLNLAINGK